MPEKPAPLRVLILDHVIGDGAVPPPSVGDVVTYPLAFREADAADPAAQSLVAHARPRPPVVGRTWSGREQALCWPTDLTGDGWVARWRAPGAQDGTVRLHGILLADPWSGLADGVTGTVGAVEVVSEQVAGHSSGTPRGRVPGSVHLRPVRWAPRWFDRGLDRAAGRTGWVSYSELTPSGPYRHEIGVLVSLDVRRPPGR